LLLPSNPCYTRMRTLGVSMKHGETVMTDRLQQRISKIRLGAAGAALTLAAVLVFGGVTALSAKAQTLTDLYNFTGGHDGGTPSAGLVRDAKGNLYGTTYWNGSSGWGTVFKVDTKGAETVLYNFTGGADGANPDAGLIRDANGVLYGTTQSGGSANWGTVFKVDTNGTETVLYNFAGGRQTDAFPARVWSVTKRVISTVPAGGAAPPAKESCSS
jgi:uncharacterized repeat protein (TIGR03803 family)